MLISILVADGASTMPMCIYRYVYERPQINCCLESSLSCCRHVTGTASAASNTVAAPQGETVEFRIEQVELFAAETDK